MGPARERGEPYLRVGVGRIQIGDLHHGLGATQAHQLGPLQPAHQLPMQTHFHLGLQGHGPIGCLLAPVLELGHQGPSAQFATPSARRIGAEDLGAGRHRQQRQDRQQAACDPIQVQDPFSPSCERQRAWRWTGPPSGKRQDGRKNIGRPRPAPIIAPQAARSMTRSDRRPAWKDPVTV